MSRLPFSSTLSPYTTLFRSSLYPSQPFPGAGSGRYHIRQISLCYRRCFKGPGDLGALQKQDRKSTTSELQSRGHLVCRLLLEKKKLTTPSQSIIMYYIRTQI